MLVFMKKANFLVWMKLWADPRVDNSQSTDEAKLLSNCGIRQTKVSAATIGAHVRCQVLHVRGWGVGGCGGRVGVRDIR